MATNLRFQVRRGTAEAWEAANSVLLGGEVALDTTHRKLKVGDGSTAWNDLPFVTPEVVNALLETNGVYDALSAYQGWLLKKDINDINSTLDGITSGVLQGEPGITPTIHINSTTSGSTPSVTKNTAKSTASDVYLDFVLQKGDTGADGVTPTINVGIVKSGSIAKVSKNEEKSTATETYFDFVLPKGDKGDSGTSGYSTETWTFTLEDGSTITKGVATTS